MTPLETCSELVSLYFKRFLIASVIKIRCAIAWSNFASATEINQGKVLTIRSKATADADGQESYSRFHLAIVLDGSPKARSIAAEVYPVSLR